MDDAGRVRLGEAVGDLVADVEQLARRERPALHELTERLAIHELHGDVDGRVRRTDLVDGDDVVVVEGGRGARLLLEAAAAIRISGELFRQDLDRHLAAQPRVARPVDLAHAAGAERRENLVRAEFLSR